MPCAKSQAICASFILPLAVLVASSRTAFGQDSPAGEPAIPTRPTTPAASDAASQSLGPVERLPASAYPSTPVRGIEGGSLWMTFHGLQWPYYPKTGIGVSGYGWIDTGYQHIARGNSTEPSDKKMIQQGRVVLRVTPTWSGDRWFVQGQAEFVGNQDQSQSQPLAADADDVWIRAGRWETFDVQVGRYEAWEVYHYGMGLDLHTLERDGATDPNLQVATIYGVTTAFERPRSIGEGAIHLYPTKFLRFELGTQYGNDLLNTYAARPVGVVDFGWMKFKAGAEYREQKPLKDGAQEVKKQWGYGASLQFVIDPIIEFGFNGAQGYTDHVKNDGAHDDQGSNKTYSLGAFVNARVADGLLVGAGADYTYVLDQQFDSTLGRYEDFDHWQVFGAVQYHLWKQLFIKGVGGYALANFNPNNSALVYKNEMVSGRLRLLYLF